VAEAMAAAPAAATATAADPPAPPDTDAAAQQQMQQDQHTLVQQLMHQPPDAFTDQQRQQLHQQQQHLRQQQQPTFADPGLPDLGQMAADIQVKHTVIHRFLEAQCHTQDRNNQPLTYSPVIAAGRGRSRCPTLRSAAAAAWRCPVSDHRCERGEDEFMNCGPERAPGPPH
jgi:hypothetical protein